MSYYRNVYLKSDEWKTLRIRKLAREKAKCLLCKAESIHNDVHHLKYRPHLAAASLGELMVLCRGCHEWVHDLLDKYPKLKRQPLNVIYRVLLDHNERRNPDFYKPKPEKCPSAGALRFEIRCNQKKLTKVLNKLKHLFRIKHKSARKKAGIVQIKKKRPRDYRAKFFIIKWRFSCYNIIHPDNMQWFEGIESILPEALFDDPHAYVREYAKLYKLQIRK